MLASGGTWSGRPIGPDDVIRPAASGEREARAPSSGREAMDPRRELRSMIQTSLSGFLKPLGPGAGKRKSKAGALDDLENKKQMKPAD